MFDKRLTATDAIALVFSRCGGRIPLSPEPRGRSRQARDGERAVKREVSKFRVLPSLLVIFLLVFVVTFFFPALTTAQSSSPTGDSESKPKDNTKDAASQPAKDDVTKNTPGSKLKPLQGLHLDVDLALVNVTVTDPYN